MIRDIVAFDWDKPLTINERETILDSAADQIVRRGLQAPSIWMLEIHRPLMPLCGQIGIAFSPALGTLFAGGAADLQKYTKLMQDRDAVEDLIQRIERKSEEQRLATR